MLGSRKVSHISATACEGADLSPRARSQLAEEGTAARGAVDWRGSCTKNKTARRLTPQEIPAMRKPACCMPHWLKAPPATPVRMVAAYIELHWIDCSRPVMPLG